MRTTQKHPRGDLSRPPVDELTAVTGSAFSLVVIASKRSRQLVAFHAQLCEGLLGYVGPLVTTRPGEKPLSTALREVHAGLLEVDAAH